MMPGVTPMRDLLRPLDLFAGFTDAELDAFAAPAKAEMHRKGAAIHRAPEAMSKFYVVESGVVEMSRRGSKARGVTRIERGDAFGEMALFEELASPVDIAAGVTPETHLWAWHHLDVQQLLARDPVLGLKLAKNLFKRLGSKMQSLQSMLAAAADDLG